MKKHPKALDSLGLDVEIANTRIPQDGEMKRRLMGIGEQMQVMLPDAGFSHCCSFATHIYRNDFGKEVRYIHHHGFARATGEQLISNALADSAVHLMETVFGRKKPATRDPRDQRGKKS